MNIIDFHYSTRKSLRVAREQLWYNAISVQFRMLDQHDFRASMRGKVPASACVLKLPHFVGIVEKASSGLERATRVSSLKTKNGTLIKASTREAPSFCNDYKTGLVGRQRLENLGVSLVSTTRI